MNDLFAIKGPRGYWASDGSQSAWVEKVDPQDAYGADTFSNEAEAQAELNRLPIRATERAHVKVVKLP